MTTYDVELEIHDRRTTPPTVLWSGTRRVTTETLGKAYVTASLRVQQESPIPKTEDYYIQILSATPIEDEDDIEEVS